MWVPIAEHGDYEVSSLGRVRSWVGRGSTPATPRRRDVPLVLKPKIDRAGRPCVSLSGRRRRLVSRLVIEAFVGPPPVGRLCAHLNGNPADNRPENLTWATPKENMAHKRLHGTHIEGGRNYNALFTDEQASAIRQLSLRGNTATLIAQAVGVDLGRVSDIITGRTYSSGPDVITL